MSHPPAAASSKDLIQDTDKVSSSDLTGYVSSCAIIAEVAELDNTPLVLMPPPDVSHAPMCRKRTVKVDEFGLSAAQRRKQIKLLQKLQRKHKRFQDKAPDAAASTALAFDKEDPVHSEAQVGDGCDNMSPVSMSPNPSNCFKASTEPLQHHVPSDSTAFGENLQKRRRGRPSNLSRGINNSEIQRRPVGQLRTGEKQNSKKKIDWPSSPGPDVSCQAGCDNHAIARFSCGHTFCGTCLSGVRKHQKKKKTDVQKL
jgi:hypothetical protein